MTNVIEQAIENAATKQVELIYLFGDSVAAFAKRNGLDLAQAENAMPEARAAKIAATRNIREVARLHGMAQRAKHGKDGWIIETVLTYRQIAEARDMELCQRALEKSKAQSERKLLRMAGDLANL